MRKSLLVTYMVAALLMVFTRCSEDEMVTPNQQQIQPSDVSADRENEAGRKKNEKYIATPITGTMDGLAFAAEYRITEFVEENEVLYAVGTLANITGEGLPAKVNGLKNKEIRMPVDTGDPAAEARAGDQAVAALACDILLLDLGPLDLDLLGLTIHLDQVVLEIVAETGAGNLLGNLLCAVTGLLDGVGALAAVAGLLNQIIDLIGVISA
jgi:hypothetical protein